MGDESAESLAQTSAHIHMTLIKTHKSHKKKKKRYKIALKNYIKIVNKVKPNICNTLTCDQMDFGQIINI